MLMDSSQIRPTFSLCLSLISSKFSLPLDSFSFFCGSLDLPLGIKDQRNVLVFTECPHESVRQMSISFIFSLTLLAPSLNVRTAKATAVLAIFRLFVCLGWIFPYNTVQRFISVLSVALRTLFSSSVLARSLMTDLMVSIVVCGKFPVCL